MRKDQYWEAGDEVDRAAKRYEEKQISFIDRIRGKGGCAKREEATHYERSKGEK